MFQRADGSVGYQLTIGRMTFCLKRGDVITRDGPKIKVDATSEGYWRRW